MLPGNAIEIIRPRDSRGPFRIALFDFDGTLSLLREGWPAIMTDMMLVELRQTPSAESQNRLAEVVEEIVAGLNGQPTIVQMQALAAEMVRRNGRPQDPTKYAAQYQKRLLQMIRGRYDDIRAGRVAPAAWAVAGASAWLDELRRRGLTLVLVSGTESSHVHREADMLGLTGFFGDAIFAPARNDPHFSKRAVIEQLLSEHRLRGDEIIGFGDGVVETEELRRVGGMAVAVASEEPPRRGVNAAKRDRLMRAGADVVIADYECREQLLQWMNAEG